MDATEMYAKVKDGDTSQAEVALQMAATELLLVLGSIVRQALPVILAEIKRNEHE